METHLVNARVLVVDDHAAHAEGMAELLALKGFKTKPTTSGTEALKLVTDWKPDAVLTDLGLPDLSGFEICRRIRSNPAWNTVAVIFHTGSQPHPGHPTECDAFLTYPVETSTLVATVTGSIMRRRNRLSESR